MIVQKVNLFPGAANTKVTGLQARHAVWCILGVLVVLLLGKGSVVYLNKQLATELEGEKARLAPLQAERELLQQQVESRQPSLLLKSEEERAVRELSRKQDLLGWLDQSRLSARGFVPSLEGLARVQVRGVWLEEIQMATVGGQLQLKGNSMAPEKVAVYLDALSKDGVFKGVEFRTLALEKIEKRQGYRFVLDSQGGDADS